jgi:uncharacterized protein (DUF433 family)
MTQPTGLPLTPPVAPAEEPLSPAPRISPSSMRMIEVAAFSRFCYANSMSDRITIDPAIRFGKPCIRGTRIAVVDILELLSVGYSIEDIPEQLDVTKEDVLAAIGYATELTEEPTRIFSEPATPV